MTIPSEQLEELADLIADRLSARAAGELIDATELAKRIGRTREFVYDHSAAFGAVRLGDGARPRVWFRWPHALDRLADLEHGAKQRKTAPRATRRPRRERPNTTVELLPVREASPAHRTRRKP